MRFGNRILIDERHKNRRKDDGCKDDGRKDDGCNDGLTNWGKSSEFKRN